MKKDDQNPNSYEDRQSLLETGRRRSEGREDTKNQKILIITVTIKTETDEGEGG